MPKISVDKIENIENLPRSDLQDLCEATSSAISGGIGFNWISDPGKDLLENYWKGVIMVPERVLFVGRIDDTIAGSIQLIKPGKSRETSSFSVSIEGHFVALWARGHGLAVRLLEAAEHESRKSGYTLIKLNVRQTQTRATEVYEAHGFSKWGVLPFYEIVNGVTVAGNFYYKKLEPISDIG